MIIGLSGFKGSGKDTVANLLVTEYGFTKVCFADALRELLLTINPTLVLQDQGSATYSDLATVVAEYGWEQAKRSIPEVRRLMQVTGTEGIRGLFGEDAWVKVVESKLRDGVDYVIADCRFPNEARFIHRRSGVNFWVDRPGLQSDGHESESGAVKAYADYILHNDSTVEGLHEDVRFLMHIIGGSIE